MYYVLYCLHSNRNLIKKVGSDSALKFAFWSLSAGDLNWEGEELDKNWWSEAENHL